MLKWSTRKVADSTPGPTPDSNAATVRSIVIPKFLSTLSKRPQQQTLVDLGPVVGSNLDLLSARLSCKFYVQNLFTDIETHARSETSGPETTLADRLSSRFPLSPRSVDGILCWDLFDYLDPTTSKTFADKLCALLRTGGILHGLFSTTPTEVAHYTRFVLEKDDFVRRQPYPATPTRRAVMETREIDRLFSDLEVTDLVLLKSSTREVLFRKPQFAGANRSV